VIDFILGLYLAGLFVRGWLRGFVKELLDLAGLIIGIAVAFRLSGPFGDFLSDRFGVTPEWARIGAGIALFLIVGMGMAVLAFYLGKVVRLPGLNLVNRIAGAGLAGAWGIVLVLVVVTLLQALPMPPVVDETLDGSKVVQVIAGEDSRIRSIFFSIAGDEVVQALVALEPLVGERRVVLEGDEKVEFEAASPDEIETRPGDAQTLFMLVNASRVEQGRSPLVWSEPLAAVARDHAREMYLEGYVSHVSPTTGTVGDRVEAAGIRLMLVGENLALASSTRAVHDGLMASEGHRANILHRDFDRVGIAAVHGPLGLMVVQVFGG